MWSRKSINKIITIGLMVSLLVILTGVFAAGQEDLAENQVLDFAFSHSDIRTMDPHYAATTLGRGLVDMLFNGLVRYKPGDASAIEPDLAKSIPEPKMVNGKQVWTFHLREGVMFHPWNGHPASELTSEDVVYSLKKVSNPKRSGYASGYEGMSFEAVDKYTVKITLDKPQGHKVFLPKVADYAGGFILCKEAVEALGDQKFKTHPVGTGPFKFKSYTPTEQIVLERHMQYFRGTPKLKKVIVHFLPSASSRESGIKTGEIDVARGVRDRKWLDKVKGPGVRIDTFGQGEGVALYFNLTVEPLDNYMVRKAIAYAIDRKGIQEYFGPSLAPIMWSPAPTPEMLTKEEVMNHRLAYEHNVEKAKELLAEAGYPDGFSLDLVITETVSYLRTMELVRAQLKKVGIKLNLTVIPHATYHKRIREDANPIVEYKAARPTTDAYLTQFYHSSSTVVEGKSPVTNFAHYGRKTEGIDDLIEAARIETDLEKQEGLWKKAQLEILEELPAYPLYILRYVFIAKPYLEWGYPLKQTIVNYPQVTENTKLLTH